MNKQELASKIWASANQMIPETTALLKNSNLDYSDCKNELAITLMPREFIKCPICGEQAIVKNIKLDKDNLPTEVEYSCSNKDCNAEGSVSFKSLYDKKEDIITYTGDPKDYISLGEFLGQTLISLANKERVDRILLSSAVNTPLLYTEDYTANTDITRVQGEFLTGYLGEEKIQCWITPFLSGKKVIINETLYTLIY